MGRLMSGGVMVWLTDNELLRLARYWYPVYEKGLYADDADARLGEKLETAYNEIACHVG